MQKSEFGFGFRLIHKVSTVYKQQEAVEQHKADRQCLVLREYCFILLSNIVHK